MIRTSALAIAAVALLATGPGLAQEASDAGDADSGLIVYAENCAACHSIVPDNHLEGPSLNGVLGRTAGTAEGYDYSGALAAAGFTWSEPVLTEYLRIPTRDRGGDQLIHTVDMDFGSLTPNQIRDLIAMLALIEG